MFKPTLNFLKQEVINNIIIISAITAIITLLLAFIRERTLLIVVIIFLAMIIILVTVLSNRPRMLFKCEKYSVIWDIKDRSKANVIEEKNLVSLKNDQKTYEINKLYSDGDTTKIQKNYGGDDIESINFINQSKKSRSKGYYDLLLVFRRPIMKKKKVEFSISKELSNAFLNDKEWVTLEIVHETKEIEMKVIFPENEIIEDKNIYGAYYHGHAQQHFEKEEIKIKTINKKKQVTWKRDKKIMMNDIYTIKWEWKRKT